MANTTLKFGNGNWAIKDGSALAYSDQYDNYKPLPFDFSRASSATLVNKAGLIESVNSGLPRIDFSHSIDGALLLEPQSTNLIPYSEDFSNSAWTKTRCIIDAGGHTSPSGENNAFKMTATDDDARLQDGSGSTGVIYTQSIYVKSATGSDVNGQVDFTGTQIVTFTATEQWQRVVTTSDNTRVGRVRVRITNSGDELLIWGAQVEVQSYPTSYIPTNGATSTRLADVCTDAGTSDTFNDSEGGLYMEFEVIEKTSSSYYVVSVRSSDGSNVLGVGARQGKAFAEMFDGANYISNNSANLIDGKNKIVLTYNSGSSAKLFLNGTKVLDFTGTIPSLSNLSQLVQGDRFLGNKYYGNISEIKYQNTLLTDAELQELTTI
jgi:hypothetical protein